MLTLIQNLLLFLYLGMKLPQDGDHELWRKGFDWITPKVIAKVRKVRFDSCSHISLYISVVLKCCPNVLHHVGSPRWSQCCSQILMVLIYFKGYFQGQKDPIWTFVIYLGQYLRNGACCDKFLYEAHIQSHIWYFSWHCDLWPWITVKSQIKVTDLSRYCIS